MFRKPAFFLGLIVLIAFFLRFYNLSINPPALTWDEASWGYNAYSLGRTGQDEFGKFLPMTFLESFGDFKPPVYAFLDVLPVKLFGLNEFAIRLPSAMFGSLTVLLTYFLVLQIFYSSKRKTILALSSAFILAISPWHILLSRAAFEANIATFFIILGVTLFFYTTSKKENMKYFFFPLLCFILAMNTFNTSRVFLPILVLLLFFSERKVILKNWKLSLLGIIPALLISIPLILFLVTPQARLRYEEVNIFSDVSVIKRVNQEIENDQNSLYSKVIHNRRFAYGVEYLRHYFDNLNPSFLFITGDGNPKFSVQNVGELYIWEAPFLVLGLLLLFRKREGKWYVIPIWLFVGIMPAATARETPHALRIETALPMFQILTAYGLVYFAKYVSGFRFQVLGIRLKYLVYSLLSALVLSTLIFFLHSYFVTYPVMYAREWQYGYKEAVGYSEKVKDNYSNIYFTQDLGRPYIYVLLFGKITPEKFRETSEISREAAGFVHVNSVDKYIFQNDLPNISGKKNLYINSFGKVPKNANIIKNFYLPDGEIILVAYTL